MWAYLRALLFGESAILEKIEQADSAEAARYRNLIQLLNRIISMSESTQDQINDIAVGMNDFATTLKGDVVTIEAAIAALQAQVAAGNPVDLTDVQAAFDGLKTTVATVDAIVPPVTPPSA